MFRVLLTATVVGLAIMLLLIQRFLAITRATGRGVLVVEAWIPEQSLKSAATVFSNGSYRYLVIVGSRNEPSSESESYPRRTSDELTREGVPSAQIVTITLARADADRTRTTAEAFKKWLSSADPNLCCVDVYTVGVHARKSWITFRSVLGRGYQVGVIAGPEPSYNPNYWIASRRGVWLVFRNLAGYLHSKYESAVGTAR